MFEGDRLYTKGADGEIQKWYVQAWIGNRFSVSVNKKAKYRDYKRYYSIDDLGKIIFFTRKEAKESEGYCFLH